jgi:hypothetical protein
MQKVVGSSPIIRSNKTARRGFCCLRVESPPGKVGAHDKTAGVPVTNFKRSTHLYRLAMTYKRGLAVTRTTSPASS